MSTFFYPILPDLSLFSTQDNPDYSFKHTTALKSNPGLGLTCQQVELFKSYIVNFNSQKNIAKSYRALCWLT